MKLEGNEFSVKELAAAICELERAKVFDKSVTEAWRAVAEFFGIGALKDFRAVPPPPVPVAPMGVR